MTYIHLPSFTRIISFFLLITFFFIFSVAPVLAARTYTYDANGNMTTDGEKCYQYNENNQLKIVRNCTSNKVIADYIYDHNGNRIAKKEYTNGVLKRIVYSMGDGFEKAKLASNSAVENTTYFMANDEVVAKKNPDGSKTYYHGDHLGSNVVLTNQGGSIVDKTTYEPYGEVKDSGNQSKFQYTGQEKDLETGLNYYDARYYDSHIQRFTQPDTLLPNIYEPQQLNRYTYANNNPLKYTDPTGHWSVVPFLARMASNPFVRSVASFVLGSRYVQPLVNKIASQPRVANAIQQLQPFTQKLQNNQITQAFNDANSNPIITNPIGTQLNNSATLVNAVNTRLGTIYRATNQSNVPTYIGKSVSYEQRARAWSKLSREVEKIPGLDKLPEPHLRPVEEALIVRHGFQANGGTLLNKIHSISPKNPNYDNLLKLGNSYLDDIGY